MKKNTHEILLSGNCFYVKCALNLCYISYWEQLLALKFAACFGETQGGLLSMFRGSSIFLIRIPTADGLVKVYDNSR